MKTTAIPKWRPGSIKVGQRYKYDYNGKTYIFQAKFNTTLADFNPIWFENVYPKKYYFVNKAAFDNSNVVLLPNDTIYVGNSSYKNTENGVLTKSMLNVVFEEYIEHRQNSYLIINGYEDHRKQLIKFRPFLNTREPELKYFRMDERHAIGYIGLYRVLHEVIIDIRVLDVFTPVRAISITSNRLNIDHAGYSVTTQGIAPLSSTSTTKVYEVPNSLITKRLTVTPDGDGLILKYE